MTKLSYQDYLDGTAEVLRRSEAEKEEYFIDILGRRFIVYPNVFSPKYFLDTDFFARELPYKNGETFLEIGCGTGVISVFVALNGARHVTCVDLNVDAVENTKENSIIHRVQDKITVLQGNVYDSLPRDAQFDTIFWNTPFGYVENDKLTILERAVFDLSYNATQRFINEASNFLNPNGRLLIGFSSTLGKLEILLKFLEEAGFDSKLIAKTQSVETHPVTFEIFEALSND